MGERHTLHLWATFENPAADEHGLTFASDAFFLPAEGWAPELLPSRGLFATGGVPPKQWLLTVLVPQGFLVHTSGKSAKVVRKGQEIIVSATQRPEDHYPFIVAGHYLEQSVGSGGEKTYLWTRAPKQAARFQQSAQEIAGAIRAYDTTFGSRNKGIESFWIVECPAVPGCLAGGTSSYANLLGEGSAVPSSELVSLDTAMTDLSGEAPKLAAAVPALAASWLGYGENPGFYEQQPPLSAFPAFAAAVGYEAVEGPAFRTETIRRALHVIPSVSSVSQGRKGEDPNVVRAKSLLFFYALQDRYGAEAFRRATSHMLSARWQKGFDLDDLMAAFGEETHQNVAEFVRLWMKHPGVPEEFRKRYEVDSAASAATSKETTP